MEMDLITTILNMFIEVWEPQFKLENNIIYWLTEAQRRRDFLSLLASNPGYPRELYQKWG